MEDKIETYDLGESLSESTDLKIISFNPDGIPEVLKERIQWVLCKLEEKDGKIKKIPYTVQGYNADVTDPKNLTSSEEVFKVCKRNPFIYLPAFVLRTNDPFLILDYDDVRDPVTGKIDPEILEEIISLNTYAEISQSDTGIHVIGKGTIPGPRRRSGCREMYQDKRAIALTGNHLEGAPLTVNEFPNPALKAIYEKIDPSFQKTQKAGAQNKKVLEDLSSTDEEIIELCNRASYREKFKKLFKGIWEGDYKSQSEADLALCSLIASRTGNFDQIDRIFRKSGLYRSKWDVHEIYRVNTITKALKGEVNSKEKLEDGIGTKSKSEDAVNNKEKTEVSNQETASKEPYVITKDKIYLNAIDSKGQHMFAYLGDSGKIEYSQSVQVDGRTIYPQELPTSFNRKRLLTVGIPLKESIDSSQTMDAKELFELIVSHFNKYIDAPQEDIEMFVNYVLLTWVYKKLNTIPYLRFLGDTGKGKSRMLRIITDICFYPIFASGGSSASGIMRFNQLWHGTLGIDEIDIVGGMENDFIKYMNLGFEAGNFFLKTNLSDLSKQEWFDPFCPKVLAMRKIFKDNATEGRLISHTPRETTREDIPIILPSEYEDEVKK